MPRQLTLPLPLIVGAVAVAVFAALSFHGTASAPAPTKPDQTAAKDTTPAEDAAPDPAHDPLSPLRRFLGVKPANQAKADEDLAAKLKSYHVESVIATIPHPTKSGFGYWYDLSLDAIARAFETAGYVPDNAFTPASWARANKDKKGGLPGPAATLPGMLLFRGTADKSTELRLVWLVGETPTYGVDKEAFRQSVKLIRDHQLGERAKLRVLGPFFSGSQPSLLTALSQVSTDTGALDVILRNGSATAINKELFDKPPGGLKVDYRTTVIPNKIVRGQVINYLNDPSFSDPDAPTVPGKMAVLFESDTGFGNALQDAAGDTIKIPFPIHISELQGVHNKEMAAALAQLGLPQTSGGIAIPQEEGERDGAARNLAPAQSPLTTAAMNDLIMKNTLSSIGRGRVKYVELVATDPRDKILLASLIRERCPDTLLFTTEGDFMLAHPDVVGTMRGMFIGSCYPLDAEAETSPPFSQMPPRNRRLVFDNQSFQGCYNAILALLDDGKGSLTAQMLGYEPTPDDSEPTTNGELPGIWISAIGQNSTIVPVYKVPMTRGLKNQLVAEGVLLRSPSKLNTNGATAPPFPTFWLCCLCFVSGLLWWFLFRYLPAYSRSDQVPPAAPPDPAGEAVQRLCLTGICFLWACLYSWIAALALFANSLDLTDFSSDTLVNRLVLLVAGGMLAVLGFFFATQSMRGAWRAFRRAPAAPVVPAGPPAATRRPSLAGAAEFTANLVLITVWFLLTIWMIANGFQFSSVENRRLYFERLTHFGSGLSPVIPSLLLVIGLAAWCLSLYKKLNYLAFHAVANPFVFPPDSPHNYGRVHKLGERLECALRPYFLRPWADADGSGMGKRLLRRLTIVIPLLVVAIVFYELGQRWIRTIEGQMFDNLMYFGLLLSAFATVYLTVHFYAVWTRLRDLLKEMAKLPLARAYHRLPATVRAVVDGALYANRPGHSALELSTQQLNLLRLKLPEKELRTALPAGEVANLETLKSALFPAQSDPAEKTSPADQAAELPKDETHTVLRACLPILQFFWQYRSFQENYGVPAAAGGAAATTDAAGSTPDATDPLQDWVACAEDYVAIEITRYLSQFFAHLRNLLNAMMLGAFLILLIITLYPFHPGSLMLVYAVGLLAMVAAVAVWVLIAINRDEVMSHLAGSTPNRFTPDLTFFREIFQYIVPVLGLLMVQFPSVSSLVRSVLDPLLRVVR
jgi:hypothetical protein